MFIIHISNPTSPVSIRLTVPWQPIKAFTECSKLQPLRNDSSCNAWLQLSSVPAARELLLLSRVINQTVGDAISGVLMAEAVLR